MEQASGAATLGHLAPQYGPMRPHPGEMTAPRITNRFQPGHPFLHQLLNKPPMSLVNEICRYHKLQAEYILLHTSGPEHAKTFCVSLQFGDIERFVGEGTSIRTAQRNAAVSALQNTRLNFPRVQNNAYNRANFMPPVIQTPASELNTMLMQKGIQPKYELTVEKISNTENNNIPKNAQYYKSSNWQQHSIPNSFSFQTRPNNFSKLNSNLNSKYPQMPISMCNPTPFNQNYPFPSQYMYPCESFRTNQPHSHFNSFNSNLNYGYNPALFNLYSTLRPSQNYNKWNTFPNNSFSPVGYPSNAQLNNNSKIYSNFEAKVEFEGNKFSGQGRTAQAARHSAASEALKYIKNQTQENVTNKEKKTILLTDNDDQSPVSLVYEMASRNRHKVMFELVAEIGQAHMPSYQMRCSLYSGDVKVPFLTAIGEARSKKTAKRAAAENILKSMKEKSLYQEGKDKPPQDKPAQEYKIFARSKDDINQTKATSMNPLSSKEETIDLCNSESLLSCKYTTLLYQLTRNLLINTPSYHLSTIDINDSLTLEYMSLCSDLQLNLPSSKLHKAECTLTFDQRLPQQLTCTVKSVGYGTNQRMAKSICTYICLLKIGIHPTSIGDLSSGHLLKSLQFSFARNQNVPGQVEIGSTVNEPHLISEYEENSDLPNNNLEEYEIVSNGEFNFDLSTQTRTLIEQNLQFIIHILGKVYLFSLKDTSKPIDRIFAKLETTLNTFYLNKYPDVSSEIVQAKFKALKEIMASLDATKYWSHLSLLSSLVLNGIAHDQLTFCKEPLLNFKFHTVESELVKQEPNLSHQVCIITSQCHRLLSQVFQFSLIKKNVVSFGLGLNEDQAREVASLWILKNISYLAKKQMIENEFDQVTESTQKCTLTGPSTSTCTASPQQSKTSDQTEAKKSKSKASQKQVTSKQCISLLFQVCSDLNIRKPYFESRKCASQTTQGPSKSSANLFLVECVLCFTQEVPEQMVTKMTICGLAPNQRMARTICAFLALRQLGLPSSMHSEELYSLDQFETYLQMSLSNNAALSQMNSSLALTNIIKTNIPNQFEANSKEIGRNFEFLIRILNSIYRPFLKNHKMTSPIQLVSRVESELFEYHNQQQQIMDRSGSFDRCSANIQQCIRNLLGQFNGSLFWHHLKLLSSIVSLLTGNLSQPLNPLVLEFKCQICPSVAVCDPLNSHISLSVPLAVVSVHSPLQSGQTCGITAKPLLSYALSQNENVAREIASYKALRHLAINMWK